MNNTSRTVIYITLISIVVINITTLINAARMHETWRIIVGGASIGLMAGAGIVMLMNKRRQKRRRAS